MALTSNVDSKQLIREFVKKHHLAVISTVSDSGHPQSAVIEIGDTDELELIFDTFDSSRKVKNIKANNRVSFVIGWDENITVQYEGEAFELSGEERSAYKEIYFKKNPRARKWEDKLGILYFKVVPKWARYSDLNKQPWKVIETTWA